jgi:hypothetical protein
MAALYIRRAFVRAAGDSAAPTNQTVAAPINRPICRGGW